MKRVLSLAVALSALLAAGAGAVAAQAAPKSDYSVDDVVKGFQQKPSASSQCNPDADGVCQPTKDSRGFSLEDSSPAPPVGAKVRATAGPRAQVASAKHHRAPAPLMAAAPVSRRDLLISFRLGSSDLTDRGKANARVFANAMRRPELASASFEIAGHTDATGSPARNRILAQQRADAVRQFMIEQGADATRLKAVGYGSDQPADSKNPDAAVNRRVEARRLS